MVVENDEKKHCPKCQSREVKLNGKTSQGKQRYQCLRCKRTYIWRQPGNIEEKRFKWFKKWLIEGFTIKQLSEINKVSQSTTKRVIKYWLNKKAPEAENLEEVEYVIFDGSYINDRTGIYVVMDAKTHKVIYGDYGVCETGKDLKVIYKQLKQLGLKPVSATIDGALQQFKYLTVEWENLIIQRCLVHIQRQGLSWLRRKPKRIEAMELRDLLLQVLSIRNKEQASTFIKGFQLWEHRYGFQLQRSTNRGKVFSDLLRTRSMILNALDYMFNFLDDPEIPKTTNPLEGYFGRLKEKYRVHKGLSPKKRRNFFKWYFYLKPL